jgi:Na+/H+ antiporter NhaA
MALFIASLAFDENLIDSAKLGIFMGSIFSAVTGLALLGCSDHGQVFNRHFRRR